MDLLNVFLLFFFTYLQDIIFKNNEMKKTSKYNIISNNYINFNTI
jgi:hypothetical protein